MEGFKTTGMRGFSNRATHNLWTLLDEEQQIDTHLANGSYQTWYKYHLDNSIYLPLIQQTVHQMVVYQSGSVPKQFRLSQKPAPPLMHGSLPICPIVLPLEYLTTTPHGPVGVFPCGCPIRTWSHSVQWANCSWMP
jgi:hypothetical protein